MRAGAVTTEAGSRGPSPRRGRHHTAEAQTTVRGICFKLFSAHLKLCRWWGQSPDPTAWGAGRPRGLSSPAPPRRWGARRLRAPPDTGSCPWATCPAVEPALAGGEPGPPPPTLQVAPTCCLTPSSFQGASCLQRGPRPQRGPTWRVTPEPRLGTQLRPWDHPSKLPRPGPFPGDTGFCLRH